MQNSRILVYGADWCGDCVRARKFLKDHGIPFEWIDIESDRVAESFVIEANHGLRSIPTILFGDGSVLVEPSNKALAIKLGILSG
jgi:glutaredoxin